MKAIYLHTAGAIALTFGLGLTLAGCVPSSEPLAPAPAPVQRPAPTPPPPPPPVVQEPRYDNYLDAPQTPGRWEYRAEQTQIGPYSTAAFVSPEGNKLFEVRCAFGDNMGLSRYVRTNRNLTMTLRTETANHTRLAPPDPEGQPLVNLVFRPNDPFLDAMAITKGRFAVETEGLPTLYLPAWVEVSRVIEDCR